MDLGAPLAYTVDGEARYSDREITKEDLSFVLHRVGGSRRTTGPGSRAPSTGSPASSRPWGR